MIAKIYAEVGGATGATIGIIKYWDHFTSEVLRNVIDGCVITFCTTFIGATVTYFLVYVYKIAFPHKKN